MPRLILFAFSLGILLFGLGTASGQNYPNKPIRVVTSPLGGGGDFVARQVVQAISIALGQPVVVENRVALIAIETVANAQPDGYTLLVAGNGMWTFPLLQKTSYDPVRDFSPITLAEMSLLVATVHPSLPVKSIKELIALAKARPGKLNYASSSNGTSTHIAGELFKAMAGVNIVRVPYKGTGVAITDLIAGEVQLMFSSPGAVEPHIKVGRLRALAVTSEHPSALFPTLPTVTASGLPGYEAVGITCVFAPARTSASIIKQLNLELLRVLSTTDVKERFTTVRSEVVGSTPEQLAAAVKTDMARLGKLIKDAGIRAE